MSSLAQFQEMFAEALLGSPPSGGLSTDPAFAVYRNTWRKALVEALAANFPVIFELVGEEAFRVLSLEHADRSAAPSPVLAGIGEDFPDFLAGHPVVQDLPYLADVARIERLITEAHLAGDSDAASRGPLLPSVRFAWLETPAVTIWEAHQNPARFDSLAPEWIGEGALVTRSSGRTAVRRIGRGGFGFLRELQAGHNVEEAAARAASYGPDEEIADVIEILIEDHRSVWLLDMEK